MSQSNVHPPHDKTALSDEQLEGLRAQLRGRLVAPGDADFHAARTVWNGMIDRRPAAIAYCSGVADVMAVVDCCRTLGQPVAVRGGGHSVGGLSVADGSVVVDLSAMNSVQVDPKRRVARVEGGAKLGELDHETQAFGLAAPVGVVSQTGVAGLTLGGGIGWLMRRHGLSIDNLLSVEIVTADGQFRRASEEEESDLFWAVRGGGGNFGVVTAFEFQLHPVGPVVWLGVPMFALAEAEEVLKRYRDYMKRAPEELGSIATLWSAPEDPDVPESVQGDPVLILVGVYSGSLEEGEKVMNDLRNLGSPVADLTTQMPFREVQQFLDADYPDGDFYYWKSHHVEELSDENIRLLVDATRERPSPATSLDVWAFGGAVSRVPPEATAYSARSAGFLVNIEACWSDAERSDENVNWTRKCYEELRRFSSGSLYVNFPGFAEEGEQIVRKSYGRNYARLQRAKQLYDPENLFRGNLNIAPER